MKDKIEDIKLMIKHDRRIWAIGGFVVLALLITSLSSRGSAPVAQKKPGQEGKGSLVASDNEAYGDLAKAFRADIESGKAKAREMDARLERMQTEQRNFQAQTAETMEVVATQLHDIGQRLEGIEKQGATGPSVPLPGEEGQGFAEEGLEAIGFDSTAIPPPPPAPAKPTRVSVITPGDSVEIELLTGVNAPVDGTPYPVVFKIAGDIVGPDGSTLNVGEGRLLAAAQGSEVDGRALFRLTQLAIRHRDGRRSVIDVDGWVLGEDGIRGMNGRLIDKLGKLILATAGVSFASGVANSIDQKNRGNIFDGNQGGIDISGDDIDFAGASAFTDASNRLSQVLIERYEKLVPVVEVLPGRKVVAVFSRTAEIELIDESSDEGIYSAALD